MINESLLQTIKRTEALMRAEIIEIKKSRNLLQIIRRTKTETLMQANIIEISIKKIINIKRIRLRRFD